MTEKLKPCPFCGGEAELAIVKLWNHVYCKSCNARTTMYSSEEQAIDAWNTRPNPWHTGTPTEEGEYLVKDTTGHYKTLVFVRGQWLIACFDDWHEFPTSDVLKWQKIEPYEASTESTEERE